MIISERLQYAMDLRHYSQSELARQINVDRAFIHYILREQKSPSIEVAIRLATALDCSLDYLVGLDTVPNRK